MIKTLNLTANTETSISGLGGAHCRINNNTSGTLYASAKSGVSAGADDVTAIPSGHGDYVVGTHGTIYLMSESGGSVQVEGTDILTRPFDSAAVTGGKAVGNPVVIDGLQGGVPFPEITLIGKNLIDYPYCESNKVVDGIEFTVGSDGGLSVIGTAVKNVNFKVSDFKLYPAGEYYLSANQSGSNTANALIIAFKRDFTNVCSSATGGSFVLTEPTELRISTNVWAGKEVNTVLYPQLEQNSAATAYKPSITGRKLTLCVNGAEYKITPDSNPYTVPADIRQQDGVNTITVSDNSNPKITVSYSSENPTLKRIYESIDRISTAIVAMGAEN